MWNPTFWEQKGLRLIGFFAIDFIMCNKTLKEIQLLKELCKVKLESVFNYKTYIMVELLPSKNLKNT